MKILFITDNFYPEKNAPAKRTFEHASEWIKMGHEVSIITSVPNFPKGKVFKGYKNKLFQKENINGINVNRVWTFISPNKGFFLRIIDYLSFMFSSFFMGLFTKKHDVVIATSPQFFTLIAGYLISLFRRTSLVIEIRDLWPDSIVALGSMSENNFVVKILYKISDFIYKKSSLIVVVTNSFKDYLIDRNINKEKIVVVKNGFNFERTLQPKMSLAQIEKLYDIKSNQFIVSYIGTIGMAHGIDTLVRAAEKARDIIFLIIGEGAEKEKIIELCKNKRLDNLKVINSLNWQQIVDINQIISLNLIHLKDLKIFRTVIPSKIFESMALKKPILAGLKGESLEIILESKSGVAVEPENENSLIEKIRLIQKDKSFLQTLSKNGHDFVKSKYDRKRLARKMIDFIELRVK